MDTENLVILIGGILSVIGLWVGNLISNRPKHEDSNINRIELIISNMEKQNEECEERVARMNEENRRLRDKVRELKKDK